MKFYANQMKRVHKKDLVQLIAQCIYHKVKSRGLKKRCLIKRCKGLKDLSENVRVAILNFIDKLPYWDL